MLLVRKGCGEDIEQEYLFIDKDRNSAVKLAKIFLSEKGDDIYSCFKDGKLYGDPDVPKGLEEFRQGKCKNLLYGGSVWVELKEIPVSHNLIPYVKPVCQAMIEVEGYMCSEPWDV